LVVVVLDMQDHLGIWEVVVVYLPQQLLEQVEMGLSL
jgi:hypothetical protein